VGPPARFATVPGENTTITGLAFDTVGSFQNELLALTHSGDVFRIDPFASVEYVGTFGPGASGPTVAASSFGAHAGRLLVAFPKLSEVRAIDPAGNVSVVLQWSGVSSVRSLPAVPRAFGATGGALFVATSTGAVYRYPLADVASRGGQLLLSSMHRSGSGIAVAEPGGYRTLPFSRSMGPEIGASFVRRPVVTPITIEILPGAASKVLVSTSTVPVPVALFATAWFSPASLVGGEVSLAGASPATKIRTTGDSYRDLNGDGRFDLVVQFRPSDMQLPLGDATLMLDGLSLEEERVRGTEHVIVQ
jgi:hypothetical protein